MFTEDQLEIFRLFSHPERVKMMALMGQGPKTAEQLMAGAGVTYGIVTTQIQLLRSVVPGGIIETEPVPGEVRIVRHWLKREIVADAVAAFVHAAELEIPPKPKKKKKKSKKKPPKSRLT
jgi:hypothetical protein